MKKALLPISVVIIIGLSSCNRFFDVNSQQEIILTNTELSVYDTQVIHSIMTTDESDISEINIHIDDESPPKPFTLESQFEDHLALHMKLIKGPTVLPIRYQAKDEESAQFMNALNDQIIYLIKTSCENGQDTACKLILYHVAEDRYELLHQFNYIGYTCMDAVVVGNRVFAIVIDFGSANFKDGLMQYHLIELTDGQEQIVSSGYASDLFHIPMFLIANDGIYFVSVEEQQNQFSFILLESEFSIISVKIPSGQKLITDSAYIFDKNTFAFLTVDQNAVESSEHLRLLTSRGADIDLNSDSKILYIGNSSYALFNYSSRVISICDISTGEILTQYFVNADHIGRTSQMGVTAISSFYTDSNDTYSILLREIEDKQLL